MSDAARHARWLVDTLGSIPNHQYSAVERHAMPVARALLAAVEGSALTPRDAINRELLEALTSAASRCQLFVDTFEDVGGCATRADIGDWFDLVSKATHLDEKAVTDNGWLPIETVPRDGRTVLVQGCMHVHYMLGAKFPTLPYGWRPDTPQTAWVITGWQPMPDVPAEERPSTERGVSEHLPPPNTGEDSE